ncbi:MAG: epoxyqueuosine reductase [Ruminococcaceae bacterium]|nr:epoxyqueuosine reductase [Oscillospiraceae bacterium]
MQHTISRLLQERGISLCAPIALCECRITKPYLLEKAGITNGTAYLFAVPYYTTFCDLPAKNISAYAVAGDYHLFFKQLFDEILPLLQRLFPQNRFAGFSDHSPIAEAEAAVRAGLGVLGCHHLFLTKRYASYVFLGEILTDAPTAATAHELRFCDACHACQRACPVNLEVASCLSALTQKKGALNESEEAALLSHGCAWGCDRCQEACPITLAAKKSGSIYTTIPYFTQNALPHLTAAAVRDMCDELFARRAYSWRGRQVILRNLNLLERGKSE